MNIIDKITVNEQSSIRIAADKVLYFDPIHISGEPHDADIIFITHEHYDHFSPDDISKVSNSDTIFAAPESMAKAFRKASIPNDRVTYLKPNDSTSILGISVKAVSAYNNLKPFHPKSSGWLGYVVTVDDTRIYVCGDTDATKEGKSVRCDIICVPDRRNVHHERETSRRVCERRCPEDRNSRSLRNDSRQAAGRGRV